MSLLMTALQKAEKSRTESGIRRDENLALEPLDPADFGRHDRAQYDPAQAATLLTAGERQSALFDFARDHNFGLVLGVLLLVGVAWGSYVWLQIKSPAFFVPKPAPVLASPAPAAQSEPVAAAAVANSADSILAHEETAAQVPVADTLPPQAPPPIVEERLISPPAREAPESPVTGVNEPSRKVAPVESVRAPRAVPAPRVDKEIEIKPAAAELAAPESMVFEAYTAFQNNQYQAAKSLYQEARRAEPKNADSLLGLAAIAALEGNNAEASRLYFRVLELDPKNATAQAGIISSAGRADPANAEVRLKSLITKEPSAHLYSVLGTLHAEQSQWPQAQVAYFHAYHLAPADADHAFNLAVSLEHLNQPKAALTYYEKALELAYRGAKFDRAAAEARMAELQSRVK